MNIGNKAMKLLKADGTPGQYLATNGDYLSLDKITKDDLLRLVNLTLHEEQVEFDEFSEKTIPNHAHQIIYKNIHQKLSTLRKRRKAFIDESERLYLEDYEKYQASGR